MDNRDFRVVVRTCNIGFHDKLAILDGFDASTYTVEDLRQEIEEFLSMGAPR